MSKLVSDVQFCQAYLASVAEDKSEEKLSSDEQPFHVAYRIPAVGNSVLNEISPLPSHAVLKFTLLASVPSFASTGNDVSAVVPCHADRKFEQLEMSVVLKSLRLLS